MRERGFSLIELLIVVAIILIIAAIAIPNLMRSRLTANEASAVSSIRQINNAQETYRMTYPNVGYAADLAALGGPSGPVTANNSQILDWVLGCSSQPCPKTGYSFQITNTIGTPVTSYTSNGTPAMRGQTGIRGFCGGINTPVMVDPNGGTNCTEHLK